MPRKLNTKQRFYAKVNLPDENGCMDWNASNRRYGCFNTRAGYRTHNVAAHRFMYELINGSIPEGMQVLHKCDRPICVAPEHLFLGTVLDNTIDKMRKNRQSRIHGIKSNFAKLNETQVYDIRKKMEQNVPVRDIKVEYGVNKTTIYNIHKRKLWKHLPELGEKNED